MKRAGPIGGVLPMDAESSGFKLRRVGAFNDTRCRVKPGMTGLLSFFSSLPLYFGASRLTRNSAGLELPYVTVFTQPEDTPAKKRIRRVPSIFIVRRPSVKGIYKVRTANGAQCQSAA